jgi:hypothetical protein
VASNTHAGNDPTQSGWDSFREALALGGHLLWAPFRPLLWVGGYLVGAAALPLVYLALRAPDSPWDTFDYMGDAPARERADEHFRHWQEEERRAGRAA